MSNIEWILIIITIFLVILLFRYIQLKKHVEETENFDADRFIQIIGGVEIEENN